MSTSLTDKPRGEELKTPSYLCQPCLRWGAAKHGNDGVTRVVKDLQGVKAFGCLGDFTDQVSVAGFVLSFIYSCCNNLSALNCAE